MMNFTSYCLKRRTLHSSVLQILPKETESRVQNENINFGSLFFSYVVLCSFFLVLFIC